MLFNVVDATQTLPPFLGAPAPPLLAVPATGEGVESSPLQPISDAATSAAAPEHRPPRNVALMQTAPVSL